MTILVLTTETLHHAAFIRDLNESFGSVFTIIESGLPSFKFPTTHLFEEVRSDFEANLWFQGGRPSISDFSDTLSVESINEEKVISRIEETVPMLTIVFGTRRLSGKLIEAVKNPLLNLHGGDPQEYRGLDSHLWAIYHKDFDNIKTTLHWVNPTLDSGDIVSISPLSITKNMKLSELRAENTRVCLDLVYDAVRTIQGGGDIARYPQKGIGRYYSAMPAVLKDICVSNFETFTKAIP